MRLAPRRLSTQLIDARSRRLELTCPGDVHSARGYGLIQIDVAVTDFKVEPAFGVNAYPSLEMDGGALSPVVG